MKKEVQVNVNYQETFRNSKVSSMFDIAATKKLSKKWDVDMPIEDKEWSIGCIIGSSGSGKTTIAKNLFPDNYHKEFLWSNNSILDDFSSDLDLNSIVNMLSHVGFSSPPNWLCPYHVLSNGQKFRVELARALLERNDLVVMDEFTSVVDRHVAKIGSYAVAKTIRKLNKKFIAISCHYDILEWLQPDWVYDANENSFKWVRLRRPQVNFAIYKATNKDKRKIWELFRSHHYLSTNLALASQCFYALFEDNICAFTSYMSQPYSKGGFMIMEHRTVVLPDYQGIGLGNKMSEFLGNYVKQKYNMPLRSVTSHPAMIFYRNKSEKWQMTSKPKKGKTPGKEDMRRSSAFNRLVSSFKYIG